MKACWRSIPSPASSCRVFRSRHSPEAIIIRKALEETTARLAAERATSSQILALQSILERQHEASAAGDSDTFHQADEMFRATVADVAGYPGIWKYIQQVKVHVDRIAG